jgi:threonine synthase
MTTTGWRCVTCGTRVALDTVLTWRCPGYRPDDPHHVLVPERTPGPLEVVDHDDPFVAFDAELAWSGCAQSHGMDHEQRMTLLADLGLSFRRTPCQRHDGLSDRLGFSAVGGVWVKDETGQVGGSHKARHLMTVLLHLLSCEALGLASWSSGQRPRLAISSCGNAAIAAATLAAAARWPIDVMVPPTATRVVLDHLERLGATVHLCPRLANDPPGDPCLFRFREAVEGGAIPFSVQGTENAWCLDGGRTLGWELPEGLDAVVLQVGGGAFASSVGAALVGAQAHPPQLFAVQTQGCAPLARAWERAKELPGGIAHAGQHWDDCMWPWESPTLSLADGILDDETYDWLGVVQAMAATGGEPVVVSEDLITAAHRLVVDELGLEVSPTGTAGLAGLLAERHRFADDAKVLVVHSGVLRRNG